MMELKNVWKTIQQEIENDEGYLIYIDPDMDDQYLAESHDPVVVEISKEDKRKYVSLQPGAFEDHDSLLLITVGYD